MLFRSVLVSLWRSLWRLRRECTLELCDSWCSRRGWSLIDFVAQRSWWAASDRFLDVFLLYARGGWKIIKPIKLSTITKVLLLSRLRNLPLRCSLACKCFWPSKPQTTANSVSLGSRTWRSETSAGHRTRGGAIAFSADSANIRRHGVVLAEVARGFNSDVVRLSRAATTR